MTAIDSPFSNDKEQAIKDAFFELVCVMEQLRRDCPWDRKQTPQSLKKYAIEEAYEVVEAIEHEQWDDLKKELGDHLFQVLFHAKLQDEEGRFDIEDVLRTSSEKMIRRHPHVFASTEVSDSAEVLANWEQIKAQERGPEPENPSIYDHLTKGLPALMEAQKISKKAAKVGFDWPDPGQVLDKIEEEIGEIREAQGSEELQEELGDLLFAVANFVRKSGFDPEETLRAANQKFIKRFRTMESLSRADGLDFYTLNLDDQEAWWSKAKAHLKN